MKTRSGRTLKRRTISSSVYVEEDNCEVQLYGSYNSDSDETFISKCSKLREYFLNNDDFCTFIEEPRATIIMHESYKYLISDKVIEFIAHAGLTTKYNDTQLTKNGKLLCKVVRNVPVDFPRYSFVDVSVEYKTNKFAPLHLFIELFTARIEYSP